jgi:hypothetical protein
MSVGTEGLAAARELALELLGEPVRRVGSERSDYTRLAGDSLVVFDASLRLSSGALLWTGDLDVTEAETKLVCLSDYLAESLFLHEPPGPHGFLEAPVVRIAPGGRVSFDNRIAKRGEDGSLIRCGVRLERHPPSRLAAWVFRQHQVWVDANGSEHEIESMPRDYVRKVLGFCERRAERIQDICIFDAYFEEKELQLLHGRLADGHKHLVEAVGFAIVEPDVLLEQLPLIRALRQRLR